jgi:hypothetical protein
MPDAQLEPEQRTPLLPPQTKARGNASVGGVSWTYEASPIPKDHSSRSFDEGVTWTF